jgi:hypothetical protein
LPAGGGKQKKELNMSISDLSIILRILDNENHLIERADQKSISLLSILGVFMVFFIAYYRIIPVNPLTTALILLYFIFALLSIIHLIMAIRPRIRKQPGNDKTNTAVFSHDPSFFTGISDFPSIADYKKSLQELLKDESSITDLYIDQIYSVARIGTAKYRYVQRGVILVIITLVIELTIIAYLFTYYMGSGVPQIPPIFPPSDGV